MLNLKDKTVGEVAAELPAAARVFEQHAIDYCCGGKESIETLCVAKGIAVEALADEIERASRTNEPEARDWSEAPLRDLIAHIVGKHHTYLKSELPRLEALFAKVLTAHIEKQPSLGQVQQVFRELKEELSSHMMKEEMILFPAIARMEALGRAAGQMPFGSIENPIARMELEHADAGRALDFLNEHTDGFRGPDWACATYRELLRSLFQLENDLHRHIHLENNILFPRAAALEGR